MAKSKYEYVREYEELNDNALNDCYIVLRIDGSNFHRFSEKHDFTKPNDERALHLANRAAIGVMQIFPDCTVGYGQSDEFSFVLRPDTRLHGRRKQKLVSLAVSKFTAVYQFYWGEFFPNVKLLYPPSFDGRIVLYPNERLLRDYLSWRQVDCHINNLYNTTFHALLKFKSLTPSDAEKRLSKTLSADKHEILHEVAINYNDELDLFKKGSVIIGSDDSGEYESWNTLSSEEEKHLRKRNITVLNCDIIKDHFWNEHDHLLKTLKDLKKCKKIKLDNKNK